MPISASIPTVDFRTAKQTMIVNVHANVPTLLIGDPGVGKSALAAVVAQASKRHLGILIGSTLDPTDVGGMPVVRVDGKGIDRIPLNLIQRAADSPALLFLDEISAAPPAVQAAFLRLILERVAGDIQLHPETRVIAACNPPEQTPGGIELTAPLMGRVCVLRLRPSDKEIREWFATSLGAPGTELRREALDFALTAEAAPEMLQVQIPAGAVAGNVPWGAPRAWERVVRARAAFAEALAQAGKNSPFDADIDSDATPEEREIANGAQAYTVLSALMAGNVGATLAQSYQAILSLRKDIPGVSDIVANPGGADVPADPKKQIAALGIVARVAEINTWAAWIYAARLREEMGFACAAVLFRVTDSPRTAKHAPDGIKARAALLARVQRAKTAASAARR